MSKRTQRLKPQPAPLWKLGRVTRTDAGGTLYNAIHVSTGREFWGVPSYDGDAMARRVFALNAGRVGLGRAKPANPYRILDDIATALDGKEWDSDTMSEVSEILSNCAGMNFRDPHDVEECGECGRLVDAETPASREHSPNCSLYRRGSDGE